MNRSNMRSKSQKSVEREQNRSDFETMVTNQLNEIITRIGAIEKAMANLTQERSKPSRDNTVITRLGMADQVEINKFGLPIASLTALDEFEVRLENNEFNKTAANILEKIGGNNGDVDGSKVIESVYYTIVSPKFAASISWSGRAGAGKLKKLALNKYARIVKFITTVCNAADSTYNVEKCKNDLKYKVIKYTESKFGNGSSNCESAREETTVTQTIPNRQDEQHWKKRKCEEYSDNNMGAQSQSFAMCSNSNVVREIGHDNHHQRIPVQVGMAHAPYMQPPMVISTPVSFPETGQHESQIFNMQPLTPLHNFQRTAEKDATAPAPYISQYVNQNSTQTSAAYESSTNSNQNPHALCTYMHTNSNIGDDEHGYRYQYTPMENTATYNHQYK